MWRQNCRLELGRLHELTYNLRWSWDHEAIALFRRLDPDLWEETGHNPEWMLGRMSQARLNALVRDTSFMAHYARVCRSFDEYMSAGADLVRGQVRRGRDGSPSSPTSQWNLA